MSPVVGTYRKGTVILAEPVEWPDGAEVEVTCFDESLGVRPDRLGDGSCYPVDQGKLKTLLKKVDQLEPFEMSEGEVKEIEQRHATWRAEQKDLERRGTDRIDRLFE